MKWYSNDESIMVDVDKISFYDISYKELDNTLYLTIVVDGVEKSFLANTMTDLIKILQRKTPELLIEQTT